MPVYLLLLLYLSGLIARDLMPNKSPSPAMRIKTDLLAPSLRPLLGPVMDLMRDGVNLGDFTAGGFRAVMRAVRITAVAASLRGQPRWEWEMLLLEPESNLGEQLRILASLLEQSPMEFRWLLDAAWNTRPLMLNFTSSPGGAA